MVKNDNKKLFLLKDCILKRGLTTALTGLTVYLYLKYVDNWNNFSLQDNIIAFMVFFTIMPLYFYVTGVIEWKHRKK